MIIDRGVGREVIIRYRDADKQRQEMRITDQYPYFFIGLESAKYVQQTEGVIRVEGGYEGVYGEPLLKVTCREPALVSRLSRNVKSWEGNIPFVNRVLADKRPDIPLYDHRKWSVDCEWKEESGELTIITAVDSYTDNVYTWFHHPSFPEGKYDTLPCKDHPEGITEVVCDPPAIAFSDECSMLRSFSAHLTRQDPDMLLGWFLTGADIKQIAGRMRTNGLQPTSLSPLRRHRYEYGDWDQPIPGRICFDLMEGFVKLWTLRHGQLPGKGLGDVAKIAIGETKLPLPDGHDTYYSDLGTYVAYNRQDTELLPRLDALLNCSDHFLNLQYLCKCDFRSTPFVTKLASSLLLLDDGFDVRIPSRPQFKRVSYEGADVQKPVPGIYENVAIFDVQAMYHSNARMHNISWDTLDSGGNDCGNGVRFRNGSRGALVRMMDYLTDLRNDYKRRKREATTPEEKAKWDSAQYAAKSLVASLYGVTGDSKFGLYHPDVAAAITYTSRKTLGTLRNLCREWGYDVIYGHTDSVFVVVESPEEAQILCARLNEKMSPIVVEVERWCERLMLKAKNRYAGKVVWQDGEYREEPDYYVKGIEMKQARMPPAMKRTMKTIINGILDGCGENRVTSDLTLLIKNIMSGEIPTSDLMIRGSLSKPLEQYKSIGGVAAAAQWANENLGKYYTAGSYFHALLDEDGNYIGFDDLSEIEGKAEIGYKHLVERFIVNKAEDLYGIVGWDITPLVNEMTGASAVEWI